MTDVEERLKQMTVAELRNLAREHNVSLKGRKKKADIVLAIMNSVDSDTLFKDERDDRVRELDDVGEEVAEIIADTEEAIALTESERLQDEDLIAEKLENARNGMLDFNTLLQYLTTLPQTFENGDYALALYQVRAAERISERVFSGWRSWIAAWTISSAEKIIAELESTGYDMKEPKRLLKVAKRAFADNKENSMLEAAEHLEKSVSASFERRMTDVDERLTACEEEMTGISEMGGNISEASQLLISAKNALLKYDHLGAEKRIMEAESSLELARTSRIQQISDYFPKVEELIKDGLALGADMAEAEHLLKLAHESFSRDDYLMTAELLGKAEAAALEGQEEQVKKAMRLRRVQIAKATEIINYNEPFLREAIAYGLDIGNSREMIERAKAALSRDDYVEGLRLANELKRVVSSLKPAIMEVREKKGIKIPDKGQCSKCGSDALSFSDNGTGVCESCGHTFMWLRLQPVVPSQAAGPSPAASQSVRQNNLCPTCGVPMNFVEGVGLVCPQCGFTKAVAVKKKRMKKGIFR